MEDVPLDTGNINNSIVMLTLDCKVETVRTLLSICVTNSLVSTNGLKTIFTIILSKTLESEIHSKQMNTKQIVFGLLYQNRLGVLFPHTHTRTLTHTPRGDVSPYLKPKSLCGNVSPYVTT